MNKQDQCGYCMYLAYDEEIDEHYCSMNLDQDDLEKLKYDKRASCRYFRMGDEYTIVRKQGFR